MDANINVLLLCGGGSSEHDISLVSAKYFLNILKSISGISPYYVEITKDGSRKDENGNLCELRKGGELHYIESEKSAVKFSYAIPCLHGYPGETGEVPGLFKMMELPFLGANLESSALCFNKISTKLWAEKLNIPTTPFIFIKNNSTDCLKKALNFFNKYDNNIFIKASNQGSAIGTFHVNQETDLNEKIHEALNYSSYCLLEKTISGRELEVAVYEFDGKIQVSLPGEIKVPTAHYTYEEKYSQSSKTECLPVAPDITQENQEKIRTYAKEVFVGLNLRHLSRVDFFLDKNEIYLNEVNTMPGHTPISMFPMMMEENGHSYKKFLEYIIKKEAK